MNVSTSIQIQPAQTRISTPIQRTSGRAEQHLISHPTSDRNNIRLLSLPTPIQIPETESNIANWSTLEYKSNNLGLDVEDSVLSIKMPFTLNNDKPIQVQTINEYENQKKIIEESISASNTAIKLSQPQSPILEKELIHYLIRITAQTKDSKSASGQTIEITPGLWTGMNKKGRYSPAHIDLTVSDRDKLLEITSHISTNTKREDLSSYRLMERISPDGKVIFGIFKIEPHIRISRNPENQNLLHIQLYEKQQLITPLLTNHPELNTLSEAMDKITLEAFGSVPILIKHKQ